MTIDRRTVMALSLAAAGALQRAPDAIREAAARSLAAPSPPAGVLPLWPEGALPAPPAGLSDHLQQIDKSANYLDRNRGGIIVPDLSLFPAASPNGAAILLVPGGSYARVGVDREGFDVARALAALGYNCGVLAYRLPHEGWSDGWKVPISDAQRAMRVLSAQAAMLGFDPERVHLLGFSAGGHLAATLAIEHDRRLGPAIDALDHASARPASVGLLYPVITMDPAATHMPSRQNLIGKDPPSSLVDRFSLERHVTAATPPSFILSAADDRAVPVANSYRFASALAAASVPHAVHVFDQGGHGFGLRLAMDRAVAGWLGLYCDWLARQAGARQP